MLRRAFLALALTPALARAARRVKACGARFLVLGRRGGTRRYLFIHGDEPTAREVLTAHLATHRGRGYLIENDRRTLTAPNGLLYDPNRMFSAEGLAANLVRLNPESTAAARAEAERFIARSRRKFLARLTPPRRGLLIALHNNFNGYSVNDEVAASSQVSLPAPGQPNEFLLCTDPADFAILSRSPFNVVLQSEPEPDDGSMSRLMARHRIRYVNIEAYRGRKTEQLAMLAWAEEHLPQ